MKRKLFAGIVCLVMLLVLLTGCSSNAKSTDDAEEWEYDGYILFPEETVAIQVRKISRISQGWIVVTADDGTTYSTNERNVIIVRNRVK